MVWPFSTRREPPPPIRRTVTYLYSTIIKGKTHVIQSGIEEDPDGRFRAWVMPLDNQNLRVYPRQVVMTEARATMAAEALAQGFVTVARLCEEQIREDQGGD